MLDNEQLKLVGDKWEKIWEFDNGNDKNKQQQKNTSKYVNLIRVQLLYWKWRRKKKQIMK